MSSIDAQKFRDIAESFQQHQFFDFLPSAVEFEHQSEQREIDSDSIDLESMPDGQEEVDMDVLLSEIQSFLQEHKMSDMVSATRDDRGVVLVLQEQTLFETAEAELLPEAEPFLDKVGTLLMAIPNMVKVEGHTDSRPISTARYPSNWELSGARASSVIRYLIDNHSLEANRFMATGYGSTRPIVPNTDEDNLRLNRRVVIVVSDPEYDDHDTY